MDSNKTSADLQKLDHELEEVRIRWLHHISGKAARGALGDTCNDLLVKLFRWLSEYEHCEEKTVLNIILNIVKGPDGKRVVSNWGQDQFLQQLKSCERYIQHTQLPLLDKIYHIVKNYCLSSSPALSSGDTIGSHKTNALSEVSSNFKLTMSCKIESIFPLVPLSLKDQEVISKVDFALGSLPNVAFVNAGIRSFKYGLICDYPAEVFMQDPRIIEKLYNLLKCDFSYLVIGAVDCIQLFSDSLAERIQFFNDPSTCQNMHTHNEALSAHIPGEQILRTMMLNEFCYRTTGNVLELLHVNDCLPKNGVNKILSLLNTIVSLWPMCPERIESLEMFGDKLTKLITFYGHSTTKDFFNRIVYIRLLNVGTRLLLQLGNIFGQNLISALAESLVDAPLMLLHREIYESIKKVLIQHASSKLDSYNEVLNIYENMDRAIDFMINQKRDVFVYLNDGMLALPCLDIIMSRRLIQLLVKACDRNYYNDMGDKNIKHLCEDIVLKLLSYPDVKIKEMVYNCFCEQVQASLGVRHSSNHTSMDNFSPIGIPISTDILVEMACYNLSCSNDNISKDAMTILTLLIKGQMLLAKRHWSDILCSLIPALPLIGCLADKKTSLGNSLLEMLNPETGEKFGLNSLQILTGNIRLLFSLESCVRKESVYRVLYLLSKQKDSLKYLPDCLSLGGLISPDICILEQPCSYLGAPQAFKPLHYYHASAVKPLLDILENNYVEPPLRKSALLQLSLILREPLLHKTFMQHGGLEMVLKVLPQALNEEHTMDFPDAVIPVVGILNQLCIYQSSIRSDLSNNETIINFVLRALFLFHNNDIFRIDCAQLLFLLCWAPWILSGTSRPSSVHSALKKVALPFSCQFHDEKSSNSLIKTGGHLMKNAMFQQHIRIHFTCKWFGGIDRITSGNCDESESSYKLPKDVNPKLNLKKADVELILNSSLDYNWMICMNDVRTAKSHQTVSESIYSSICLFELCVTLPSLHVFKSSVQRFFNAPPSSTADCHLLISVLELIANLVRLGYMTDNSAVLVWMNEVLQDPDSTFLGILHGTEMDDLCLLDLKIDLINVIHNCVKNTHSCTKKDNYISERRAIDSTLNQCHRKHNRRLEHKTKVKRNADIPTYKLPTEPNQYINKNIGKKKNELFETGQKNCSRLNENSSKWIQWTAVRQTIIEVFCQIDIDHSNMLFAAKLVWCLSSHTSKYYDDQFNVTVYKTLTHKLLNWLWFLQEMQNTSSTASIRPEHVTKRQPTDTSSAVQSISNAANNMQNDVPTLFINDSVKSNLEGEVNCTDLFACVDCFGNFTGTYFCKYALLVLSNTLLEMHQKKLEWESVWFQGTQPTYWVLSVLLNSEDICIKTGTLQLLSALSLSSTVTTKMIEGLKFHSGGIYTTTADIFLNGAECCMVRYQAGVFLLNLISHTACCTPEMETCTEFQGSSAKHDITKCLQCTRFFVRSLEMLSSTLVYPSYDECLRSYSIAHTNTADSSEGSTVGSECYEAVQTSRYTSSTNQNVVSEVTTFDIIRVLAQLTNNLIAIDSDTRNVFHENTFFKKIFRTIQLACSGMSVTVSSLQMCSAICQLLRQVCMEDDQICLSLVEEVTSIYSTVLLINTAYNVVDAELCLNLMTNVLGFLAALCCLQNGFNNVMKALDQVTPNMFLYVLCSLLRSSKNSEQQQAHLNLGVFISMDIKDIFKNILDKTVYQIDRDKLADTESENIQCTMREIYFKLLLRTYRVDTSQEKYCTSTDSDSSRRGLLVDCLCLLVFCSEISLKELQELLEIVLEQLDDLYASLGSSPSTNIKIISDRKTSPAIIKLKQILKIITVLFSNKTLHDLDTGIIKRFCALIHNVWTYALANKELLIMILECLCNFTEDCLPACKAMSQAIPVSFMHGRKLSSVGTSRSTIICLVSLIGDHITGNQKGSMSNQNRTVQLTLTILSHCCISVECRFQMHQGELLTFYKIGPKGTLPLFSMCWLRFLVMFTRTEDGQRAVARTPNCLSTILHSVNPTPSNVDSTAVSVIHNIACNPENRPILLSSALYKSTLSLILANGNTTEKLKVLYTIWHLTANNQKAKQTIKNEGFLQEIENIFKSVDLIKKSETTEVLKKVSIVLIDVLLK